MATIFRSPLITRIERRSNPAPLISQGSVWQNPLLTVLKGKDVMNGAPGEVPDYDWPNPSLGKPYPIALRTFIHPLKLNLLGKDSFFGAAGMGPAYDYPNPKGKPYPSDLRTFTNSVDISLVGKDQFFSAAGVGPAYDWPNPQGKRYPSVQRTFVSPLAIQLAGKDQFFGAAGQVPSFDWPNPRGKTPSSELRTFLQSLALNLLPVAAALPGSLYDWPNPRGRAYPTELRTFRGSWAGVTAIDVYNASQLFWDEQNLTDLTGFDLNVDSGLDIDVGLPHPAGSSPTTYWTQIASSSLRGAHVGRIAGPYAIVGSVSDTMTLAVDGGSNQVVTFTTGSRTAQQICDEINAQTIGLTASVVNTFVYIQSDLVSDQSSLRLVASAADGCYELLGMTRGLYTALGIHRVTVTAYNSLGDESSNPLGLYINKLSELAMAPFCYDFRNPDRRQYPIALRTWLESVKLNLLGKDQFFAAAGMGPSYDYPNPRGARFPIELRTWESFAINLLGQIIAAVPFFMADYPNPRAAIFPQALRTWLDSLKVQLADKDQFFSAAGVGPAYDYPNPSLGKPYPVALRTFLEALKIQLQGKDLFFGSAGQPPANLDWPNPKGKQYPQDLRGFTNPLKLNLLGQDALPHASWAWPVPRGRIHPLDLRTFIDALKLELLGKDQFFGAPGVGPAFDYPNPRGKTFPVELRTLLDPTTLNLLGGIVISILGDLIRTSTQIVGMPWTTQLSTTSGVASVVGSKSAPFNIQTHGDLNWFMAFTVDGGEEQDVDFGDSPGDNTAQQIVDIINAQAVGLMAAVAGNQIKLSVPAGSYFELIASPSDQQITLACLATLGFTVGIYRGSYPLPYSTEKH